jgi:hypothetical protein
VSSFWEFSPNFGSFANLIQTSHVRRSANISILKILMKPNRSFEIGVILRNNLIFESAEEENRNVSDLRQRRFAGPYLMTERSKKSGGRESAANTLVQLSKCNGIAVPWY